MIENINQKRLNVDANDPVRGQFLRADPNSSPIVYPKGLDGGLDILTEESGPYILFSAFKYQRGIQQSFDTGARIFSIALPMPGNMGQAYGARWQQFDAGIIGAATSIEAGGTGQFSQSAKALTAAGAMSAIGQLREQLNKGATGRLANDMLENEALANTLSAVNGIALNPRREMAFNGMDVRTHGFQFQLTPRDADEAEACEQIIKNFRNAQHSNFNLNRVVMEYPLEFVIEFYQTDGTKLTLPSTIPDCYLTNFQYVVNPGVPNARFHSGGKALSYMITLQFTESVALSREDIILIDNEERIEDGAI